MHILTSLGLKNGGESSKNSNLAFEIFSFLESLDQVLLDCTNACFNYISFYLVCCPIY